MNAWPLRVRSVSHGKFSLPLRCELTIDCVHSILLHLRILRMHGASCTYGMQEKKRSLTRISERLFIRLVCWCACAYTSHDGKTHCPSNNPFTVRRAQCGTMVNRTLLGQCIRPSYDVYVHAHHQTSRINNHADISSKDPLFRTYMS